MAYTLVAQVQRDRAGASAAIDTTGANLIVIVNASDLGGTPTDSKSNTYTQAFNVGSSPELQIFYLFNPTVGSGHTFTPGGSFPALCVGAFSGSTSAPLDQLNAVINSYNTGSITPTENGELVIAATAHSGVFTATVDSPFTLLEDTLGVDGTAYAAVMAYYIQATAAAVSGQFNVAGGGKNSGIASFKPATGGGGATWPGYIAPFGWN